MKHTRKTLVISGICMVLCMAMLVGATFAWFTDSASTAVNKIQAGTLDIALEMKDANGEWVDAEGEMLSFKKASNAPEEEILWEPGATYALPAIRIVNKGNLWLKYKVEVAEGITNKDEDASSVSLLDVIDFYVIEGEVEGMPDPDNAKTLEEYFAATNADGEENIKALAPNGEKSSESKLLTIVGHMKESAGNDYQGLTLDGVAITVLATQYTKEYDSYTDQYDKDAQYPYPVSTDAELAEAITTVDPGSVITLTSGTFSLPETDINEGVTIAGNGADNTVVKTSAEGYTVKNDNVTIKDVKIDGTAASNVNYSGAVNLKGNNATIENSVINGGGTDTWGASVYVNLGAGETAYIKNTKISGGFRGVFLGSQQGSVVLDNCDIDATYPISVDGGGDFTVTVTNSKLHGWTSYSTITSATFTNTEFSMGSSGYDVVAAYTDTTFTDCTFDNDFKVYAQTAGFDFVFNNCTKNGTPVTADNFKTLFPADSDVWTKCTCTVNGVLVTP